MPHANSLANLRQGGGRAAGSLNKYTGSIKEMIERALTKAGGVDYLTQQAHANPVAFMGLVARVLPLQLAGHDGGRLEVEFRWRDADPMPAVPSLDSPGRDEPRPAATIIDGDAVDVDNGDETTTVTFIGEC